MSEVIKASCHCGKVCFEVELENGLENIRRCNCSLCSRKGGIIASVSLDKLKITKGEEVLSLYQWNSKTAKHYFCSKCGIYTHHQRRSDPTQFGFNIACLEGINPFDYKEVPIGDGASQKLI
jgi:hypothetical protein